MKTCNRCFAEKSIQDFRVRTYKSGNTAVVNACKSCENKSSAERKKKQYTNDPEHREKLKARDAAKRANEPEKILIVRMRNSAKNYGLDPNEVINYYYTHNKQCDICFGVNASGRTLAIDHCHTTGKFRGLLCSECNLLIGKAKDSPRILIAAIDYLNRNA